MKVISKIGTAIATIGIILLIWITLSFVDTNKHNNPTEKNYLNYSQWNFFEVVSELI